MIRHEQKCQDSPNAMVALNIPLSDILDEVDNVMGLAAFLELAGTASINW